MITFDLELLTQDAIALLRRLIATPRTSRNETAASDVLAETMSDLGFVIHREANNLWCVAPDYDAVRKTLLLNAHIDTVKPVSAWNRDPFTPTLEGERLYGLGANDDGASLVALLQAFRVLSTQQLPYNLIFLASAEEEVSGKDGMERVFPLLPKVDCALVGEPTGMQPAICEKGLMVLDMTAHGKAGHAARNEGVNAIYQAMEDIQWLKTYDFPMKSEFLGPVKMSVTMIQAGTQHNVVPNTCTFTVDVRSNEFYSNEELYKVICEYVKSDVQARSFRLNSSHIAMEHPLVQAAVRMGKQPFGSPTLSDQALLPVPSMKMGPGQSSRSHSADEFVEIGEIRQAIAEYIAICQSIVLD